MKNPKQTLLHKILAILIGSAMGIWMLYLIIKGIIAIIELI